MTRLRRVLHLSDPHLTGSGIDMDGVDATGVLSGLLHDLRFITDLDLVVVSGDLADDGSVAGVDAVRQLVGEYAAARGAPHVYTTGNHDDRASFASVLGSGHRGADGSDQGLLSGPGCAAASDVDGLRVITLDTLVPGHVHGELGEDQLSWLAEVLGRPAHAGTLLVMHHPPVSLGSAPATAAVCLRRPHDLEALVGSSDVCAILAGHLHHELAGTLAGVPVWVGPGVVTRMDKTAPDHLGRAVLGAGATLVELSDRGTPTFHLLHARDARPPVYVVDHTTGSDVPDRA